MKLTKKLEAEILKLYHSYWDAYLKGDLKTFVSYFDSTITVFGTAKGEVFTNKKAAERFYKVTAHQMTGKAEMRNRKIALKVIGTAVLINEQFDLYVLVQKKWMFYGHARLTSMMEQKGTSWKIVLQHASFPDSRTEEGDQIATEKIKTENLKLREAVQRRTVELEDKNRELEIETSLEKVRAVAMSMKEPAAMLNVCKTISLQLQSLGVKDIRNVQTAIFYESKGTYMNYEYYAKHDRTFITEVDFKNHKIQSGFAKKMMKGPNEEVLEHLKGKKLQDWYAYQKTTTQFADKYLLKTNSLNYYWYSIGPVALGISTYYPLTKDETVLFKRFLKVFELAYRRYLDIEKAEAQAREAQIELSLERVRAGAMAMRQSVELGKLIFVLYQELTKLDTKLDRCFIMIVNPENKGITWWLAGKEGLLAENGFFIQRNQHPSHLMYLDHWKKRKKKWQYLFEGKEKRDWDKFGFNETELTKLPAFIQMDMAGVKSIHLSGSSDQFGSLVTGSMEPLPEEQQEIISRFAIAFNQAYIRFLDLQKAEAQAREAQIEAALERVRARTMAMQHSEELAETVTVMFDQFKTLGEEPERMAIEIVNKEEHVFDIWATQHGGSQLNLLVQISLDEPHVMQKMYKAWKAKTRSITIDLQGNELEEYFQFLKKADLPVQRKIFGKRRVQNVATFSKGILTIITPEPRPQETIQLLERFAAVFDGTYTRFLDLQKAEVQSREAQINLAVERVRARALAMYKSEEILELVFKLKQEMMDLEIPNVVAATIHLNEKDGNYTMWDLTAMEYTEGKIHQPMVVHYRLEEVNPDLFIKRMWENTAPYFLVVQGEEDLKRTIQFLRDNDRKKEADESEAYIKNADTRYAYHPTVPLHNGRMCIDLLEPPPDEIEMILTKMGAAFDLAYKRFEDLKNSEVQLREALIEAALEKVRSRTMAMHKSEELKEVIKLVYQQLVQLKINLDHAGFVVDYKPKGDWTFWIADEQDIPSKITHPWFESVWASQFNEAKEKAADFFATLLNFEEKNKFYNELLTYIPGLPKASKEFYLSCPALAATTVLLENVGLYIENFSGTPYTDEENNTLLRFGKVFQQTYTRFLDLQKAESQVRESQVEAALERVRSKTMAMHNSQDVGESVATLFEELVNLEVLDKSGRCGIGIMHPHEIMEAWTASKTNEGKAELTIGHIDMKGHQLLQGAYNSWKQKDEIFQYKLESDDKQHYFNVISNQSNYKLTRDSFSLSAVIVHTSFYFNEGCLYVFSQHELSTESSSVFIRFAAVFGQTYRRYLDLQKAEAQAREAQIESALEKVRSRSLAMHKSEELGEVVVVLFEMMNRLAIKSDGININIVKEGTKDFDSWPAAPGQTAAVCFHVPYFNHTVTNDIFNALESKKDLLTKVYSFEEKNSFFEYLYSHTDFGNLPEKRKKLVLESTSWEVSIAFAKNMGLSLHSYSGYIFTDNDNEILKRFAKVFEQSYTRFLDLQKAEAQTLEAIKRASVDRVRAEIASMRTTSDLERIQPLIWNELKTLSVPFIRCGVFIMDEEQQQTHTFLSTPDGKAIAAFRLPFYSTEQSKQIVTHWQQKQIFKDHMDEAAFTAYTKNLVLQGAVASSEKYVTENRPTDLYLHFLPFLQGMLYVGSNAPLKDYELQLVQNLADAFSTAYARYEDFNKLETAKKQVDSTLNELQVTQKQLIQSEKMASLGELTAGIAHEIQNPLNFVNNFSEVSNELLDEMMEEVAKGNYAEVKAIADDVKMNLEKINHHGKRADGIVKGMLQHSRSSSATKEPTDINKLADEYLRLAYHGLRAKDKSFNATMKTDFDENIGNINIIPQDIGRVILNLITNAFYAAPLPPDGGVPNPDYVHSPTVWVSTKKMNDKVFISVRDNGPGIPQKILDKIFQPFFTTKPTGQGTGLGLSLSYDIVKAHGGELRVETKEGDGSVFIIVLNETAK